MLIFYDWSARPYYACAFYQVMTHVPVTIFQKLAILAILHDFKIEVAKLDVNILFLLFRIK